jgi:hypothetical protein
MQSSLYLHPQKWKMSLVTTSMMKIRSSTFTFGNNCNRRYCFVLSSSTKSRTNTISTKKMSNDIKQYSTTTLVCNTPPFGDNGCESKEAETKTNAAALPSFKQGINTLQQDFQGQKESRAKEMANDKMKSLQLGLPGIISLYESTNVTNNDVSSSTGTASSSSLSIIDGQHRVGMMSILQDKLCKE